MTDPSSDPAASRGSPPPIAPGADADDTRSALVRAGVDLFGRKGYDGTSTREIAAAAGVNIAGIAYHFGGKAGLHRACGTAVAALLLERVEPIGPFAEPIEAFAPEVAADVFVGALHAMARFMLGRPEAESIARFMVREQMDPSPTFDVLYDTLIRPRHELLCRLFARATGELAESEQVVVAVSAVFGQIMFFRVGRATALRRLGWETIDADRLKAILAVVTASVRATIAARRAAAEGSSHP